MADYKSMFSDKSYKTLRKQSADSLRKMLKGKSFMQAAMETLPLLEELVDAEGPYLDELEELAVKVLKEAFPIVEEAGIEVEATLVERKGLSSKPEEEPEEEEPEELGNNRTPEEFQAFKRRIINGITQGASIRGTKAYYLFRDAIDDLNPELLEKYNTIMDHAFGVYDDDNAIAMFLAMVSQGAEDKGGESEAEYEEETGTLKIKAKALVFPMLVHELVKGLYEILSLQGFTGDKEQNAQVVQNVDKLSNEPEDLRYGKFIYDALNKHVIDSTYFSPSLREYFFIEVYKLSDEDFKSFIENSINDELTPYQKLWVDKILKKIASTNKE